MAFAVPSDERQQEPAWAFADLGILEDTVLTVVLLICVAVAIAGRATYLAAADESARRRSKLAPVRVRVRRP